MSEPCSGEISRAHLWATKFLAISAVVEQVARLRHVCAIRRVAKSVHEAEERRGQGRTRSVQVRANGLRVVQGVPCQVHCGAIWQVADVVVELQLVGRWQVLLVVEARSIESAV